MGQTARFKQCYAYKNKKETLSGLLFDKAGYLPKAR